MQKRQQVVGLVFYAGLVVVLLGVLFQVWADVLPGSIANRIGRNSEAYLSALLIAGWIQFARPRLHGVPNEWFLTAAAGVTCLSGGLLLLASDLDPRFRTLNEALLAAAILIPYVQAARPLPNWLPYAFSGGVAVAVIVGNSTGVVTDLAETLGLVILAPIGLDIVDRAILDPDATSPPRLRYLWYSLLVVCPVLFALIEARADLTGVPYDVNRYLVRITEAFIAMLLIELYFTFGLGRIRSSLADRLPQELAPVGTADPSPN